MSKSELLNKIAVALGGRAAEEIKFQDVSTGAHNDLSRATNIARSMVKEYGMSSELGHIYFEKERQYNCLYRKRSKIFYPQYANGPKDRDQDKDCLSSNFHYVYSDIQIERNWKFHNGCIHDYSEILMSRDTCRLFFLCRDSISL